MTDRRFIKESFPVKEVGEASAKGVHPKELLPQVKTAFEKYHPADKKVLEEKLQQARPELTLSLSKGTP